MSESQLYKDYCLQANVIPDNIIEKSLRSAERSGHLKLSGSLSGRESSWEALGRALANGGGGIVSVVAADCLLPIGGIRSLLSPLCSASSLKQLDLSGNNISAEGTLILADALGNSKAHITKLILKWNNLGMCPKEFSKFCESISKNHCLEHMDLRNNQITTDEAICLADSLSNNRSVRYVDLRWNSIETKGAEKLLSLMENSTTLKWIRLEGNPISTTAVTSIVSCAKYKESLRVLRADYEGRIAILVKHIKDTEDKKVSYIDLLCQSSKKHIEEAELKLSEMRSDVVERERRVKELELALKEIEANYNWEKERADKMEELVKEKEANYVSIIETYQQTIEGLRQATVKLENDYSDFKVNSEQKFLNEKEKRERAEGELDFHKRTVTRLKEEVEKLRKELQTSVHERLENLEAQRSMWQKKYSELDKSCEANLEKLRTAAVDKQEHLEKTILELTETQARNLKSVTERLERCTNEKNIIENQLAGVMSALAQLQKENSELLSQVTEPSKRLAAVLHELSDEKLNSEKLRQDRIDMERKYDELRNTLSSLKSKLNSAAELNSEQKSKHNEDIFKFKKKLRLLADKLKQRDILIKSIKEEEQKRAKTLFSAVNSYVKQIPHDN